MFVCCVCCVLVGRGLCDVARRCVCSRNLLVRGGHSSRWAAQPERKKYIIIIIIILYYIIYYNIIIVWDHRRICGPSLTKTSLCGAYLYFLKRQYLPLQTLTCFNVSSHQAKITKHIQKGMWNCFSEICSVIAISNIV
jgi:hypothetical protein